MYNTAPVHLPDIGQGEAHERQYVSVCLRDHLPVKQ
jgi:hypothetical protein